MTSDRYKCFECGVILEVVQMPEYVPSNLHQEWMQTPPSCFCGTVLQKVSVKTQEGNHAE